MLATRRLRSTVPIDLTEGGKLIEGLAALGFDGLLRAAERTIIGAVGLKNDLTLKVANPLYERYGMSGPLFAEIFYREGCLLYLRSMADEEARYGRHARRTTEGETIELGALGHFASDTGPTIFSEFVSAVQTLLREKADQADLGLDRLSMSPVSMERDPRIAFRPNPAARNPRLEPAHFTREEVEVSVLLCHRNTLELARRVSQVKSVPGPEIEKEIAETRISQVAFDRLVEMQFFVKRAVIECRHTGAQLVSLGEANSGGALSSEVAQLNCPTCRRALADERIAYLFDLGELGKRLVQKNHWLTVLTTEKLMDLGIAQDEVLWNIEDGADEVDILTIFRGQAWVFELKDREFGAGDAQRFSFRRSRLAVGKSFVVTTNAISPDAKEVFKEVERQSRRTGDLGSGREPVYVEGLEGLETALIREATATAVAEAKSLLTPFAYYSSYDFGQIVDSLPIANGAPDGASESPPSQRRPRVAKKYDRRQVRQAN